MTFNLRLAVLAMLTPVVERDPERLQALADNLCLAALAATRLGHEAQGVRYMDRAGYLLTLAGRA